MGFRSLAPVGVPLDTNVLPWEGRKKVKDSWTAGLVDPLIKVTQPRSLSHQCLRGLSRPKAVLLCLFYNNSGISLTSRTIYGFHRAQLHRTSCTSRTQLAHHEFLPGLAFPVSSPLEKLCTGSVRNHIYFHARGRSLEIMQSRGALFPSFPISLDSYSHKRPQEHQLPELRSR